MARKFDLISELYERTCFAVTDNPVNWQSFLKTAGRNFRLRFDEQLLIYAQRPDATAVLEIERWNGTFGRWVNRGAKVSPCTRTPTEVVKGSFITLIYQILTRAAIPALFLFGK